MKTAYQYVVDLRDRVEQTCELAKQELAKARTRNKNYYNRRTRKKATCRRQRTIAFAH